ncbi:luciferin 4-monooxygenase [Marssonina coronariae]|uniref:Luciferin 4-monooxygenase n=1 Tax=Diplocarpon coronariae TaxID=2795749 RepID=A0A218YWB0_9HELO|nr:luciferin 4-monooxygenase [Marssonina coronariae]
MPRPQHLLQLLNNAACNADKNGITIYSHPQTKPQCTPYYSYENQDGVTKITYHELQQHTLQESEAIRGILALLNHKIVLLHVNEHLDSIHWFWSIVAAGGIPCMCSPFSQDPVQRQKQVNNLIQLLDSPPIILSDNLIPDFEGVDRKHLWSLSSINSRRAELLAAKTSPDHSITIAKEDTAVLMLTSGSTGNAKAVCLTHGQILASVSGKSQMHKTTTKDVFLNWTGLDHVANLMEIHLHAISLGANQVHLPAAEVLGNPLGFLEKIDKHRVSYTFAPNFFLGTLINTVLKLDQGVDLKVAGDEIAVADELPFTASLQSLSLEIGSVAITPSTPESPFQVPASKKLDLSCLRALISGGESNVVQTCADLTDLLQVYNASESFIRPGFGMTETCAGCIYNTINCPAYDVSQNSEFCCLGEPFPGMEMRILRKDGSLAHHGEIGELQVSGAALFPRYYNNVEETGLAKTSDGWFKTGDNGTLDVNGRLCLTGRAKDLLIINGINLHPQNIESALNAGNTFGLTPSYTVVFGHRPTGSHTEVIVVVYLPAFEATDPAARSKTAVSISRATVTYCGVRPFKILPLPSNLLQKSTLGKISRAKTRAAFESGLYDDLILADESLMRSYHEQQFCAPKTGTEKVLAELCQGQFGGSAQVGVNSNLFELGASSVDLLTLKMHLQQRLGIETIPITCFFSHPILRDLASSVSQMTAQSAPVAATVVEYDPVVILNPNIGSTKTPIWFIHPGMGEILIFLNLSRHITDRPRLQPRGPYALCGYSFGSILTFEIAKLLEASGAEVQFLGTLDQPPFFKQRARTYDWYECVMTVAFFLGLMGEGEAYAGLGEMRRLSRDEVLDGIVKGAPAGRMEELGLTRKKIDTWAELAYRMKVIAWDYDPEGLVKVMDVFYTGPLIGLVQAKTMEEWRRDFIGKWDGFVETKVKYHEVNGTHRTIISPPFLVGFWKVFHSAMEARGL